MRIVGRTARKPVSEIESPPVQRIRLLIVDENPTALTVMGRRLSHRNYDVTLAENGFTALSLLQAQRFDLILIEMNMRLISGVAAMRKMRASGLAADASIVMITGRSDSAAIVEALEAGADDQISKPFDFDILDARARHIVNRARMLRALEQNNAHLDARIAHRAVELGEARTALEELQADRARLVSSIQALHDEVQRLNAANN